MGPISGLACAEPQSPPLYKEGDGWVGSFSVCVLCWAWTPGPPVLGQCCPPGLPRPAQLSVLAVALLPRAVACVFSSSFYLFPFLVAF